MHNPRRLFLAAALATSANIAVCAELPPDAQHLIDTTYASPKPLHRAVLAFAQDSVEAWTAAKLSGQSDPKLSDRASEARACLTARVHRLLPDAPDDWAGTLDAALVSTPEMNDRRNVFEELTTGAPESADVDGESACGAAGIR